MAIIFSSIFDLIQAFPDEESCIHHLEKLRWGNDVISPFDSTSKVYVCKNNKYKCKNTGKYFDVKTNTLFHGTKVSLQKWFLAIYLATSHKKGISSVQLHKDIGVTQKTAWFMLQRIRNCYKIRGIIQLQHEVEIDETYVGGKNKNRHFKKRVRNAQGRSFKDKTPVLGMVERTGRVIAKTVTSVSSETINPMVLSTVSLNAKVYTDEWKGYNNLKKHISITS